MAKWLKVCIIIAVCLLVIGATVFVIGMSSIGWDFMELDTLEYTEINVSAQELDIENAEDINAFEYYGHDWNVNITKGETFSIKYYVTEDTKSHSVTYSGGKVVFKYEENWFNGITAFRGLKKLRMSVDVTIPENINLVLESTNLNVDISAMSIKDIDVKGTNVDLVLNSTKAGNIKIESTNADVVANGSEMGDFRASATNCDINFTEVSGKALSLTGTNTDTLISGGSFASIYTKFTNNDVRITGCKDITSYEFTGTNIDVELTVPHGIEEFASITFEGTNRNGRINGEKSTGYSSQTGSVRFASNGTNNKVRIYTA